MRRLLAAVKRRAREERGAETLEWVLIGAGVAIIITGLFTFITPRVTRTAEKLGKAIESGKQVETLPGTRYRRDTSTN